MAEQGRAAEPPDAVGLSGAASERDGRRLVAAGKQGNRSGGSLPGHQSGLRIFAVFANLRPSMSTVTRYVAAELQLPSGVAHVPSHGVEALEGGSGHSPEEPVRQVRNRDRHLPIPRVPQIVVDRQGIRLVRRGHVAIAVAIVVAPAARPENAFRVDVEHVDVLGEHLRIQLLERRDVRDVHPPAVRAHHKVPLAGIRRAGRAPARRACCPASAPTACHHRATPRRPCRCPRTAAPGSSGPATPR